MDQASEFREAAEHHNAGRGRTGWRYPPEIRSLALSYAYEAQETGDSLAAIAAELGITPMSLSRWMDAAPSSVATVVPVQVTALADRASAFSVVTPGGLRIEGLDWDRLLDLVETFG